MYILTSMITWVDYIGMCVLRKIFVWENLHCVSREIKWWRDFSSLFHVPNDVAY